MTRDGEVVPVLVRGRDKDGDDRLFHSPIRCSTNAFTVVSTAPRGPWADAPVEGACSPRAGPGDSPYTPGGATTKNGVGRLPDEEAADAVVKEKSLRPW